MSRKFDHQIVSSLERSFPYRHALSHTHARSHATNEHKCSRAFRVTNKKKHFVPNLFFAFLPASAAFFPRVKNLNATLHKCIKNLLTHIFGHAAAAAVLHWQCRKVQPGTGCALPSDANMQAKSKSATLSQPCDLARVLEVQCNWSFSIGLWCVCFIFFYCRFCVFLFAVAFPACSSSFCLQ